MVPHMPFFFPMLFSKQKLALWPSLYYPCLVSVTTINISPRRYLSPCQSQNNKVVHVKMWPKWRPKWRKADTRRISKTSCNDHKGKSGRIEFTHRKEKEQMLLAPLFPSQERGWRGRWVEVSLCSPEPQFHHFSASCLPCWAGVFIDWK